MSLRTYLTEAMPTTSEKTSLTMASVSHHPNAFTMISVKAVAVESVHMSKLTTCQWVQAMRKKRAKKSLKIAMRMVTVAENPASTSR